MWHVELNDRTRAVAAILRDEPGHILGDVHPTATLDFRNGPITIGAGTRVCENAVLRGPLIIGEGCIIGTNVVIRGSTSIGNKVLIGNGAEVKNAIIEDEASLGPYSYVADSIVREEAFLGALVRTSNFRLDQGTISVREGDGTEHDTGMTKLGCEIGTGTALGVGCIILPGRIVPEDSTFGPGVHITKNLQRGRYAVKQDLSAILLP